MSQALCCHAFETLVTKLHPKATPVPLSSYFKALNEDPHGLPASAPLFITWTKNGLLRGCIGTFQSLEVGPGVGRFALTAALDDSRFSPVGSKEVALLEVGVTLLANFVPIQDPNDWMVGLHGLKISFSHDNQHFLGTFLPSVAEDEHWDKTTTLYYLLRKADYPYVKSDAVQEWYTTGIEEGWVRLTRYDGVKSGLDYETYSEIRNTVGRVIDVVHALGELAVSRHQHAVEQVAAGQGHGKVGQTPCQRLGLGDARGIPAELAADKQRGGVAPAQEEDGQQGDVLGHAQAQHQQPEQIVQDAVDAGSFAVAHHEAVGVDDELVDAGEAEAQRLLRHTHHCHRQDVEREVFLAEAVDKEPHRKHSCQTVEDLAGHFVFLVKRQLRRVHVLFAGDCDLSSGASVHRCWLPAPTTRFAHIFIHHQPCFVIGVPNASLLQTGLFPVWDIRLPWRPSPNFNSILSDGTAGGLYCFSPRVRPPCPGRTWTGILVVTTRLGRRTI